MSPENRIKIVAAAAAALARIDLEFILGLNLISACFRVFKCVFFLIFLILVVVLIPLLGYKISN